MKAHPTGHPLEECKPSFISRARIQLTELLPTRSFNRGHLRRSSLSKYRRVPASRLHTAGTGADLIDSVLRYDGHLRTSSTPIPHRRDSRIGQPEVGEISRPKASALTERWCVGRQRFPNDRPSWVRVRQYPKGWSKYRRARRYTCDFPAL
jgi:hypothetical protein